MLNNLNDIADNHLVALATLSIFGAVHAQSSVTLFGVLDATLNHTSATNVGSVNQLSNSGLNSSRLGFKGTEDLGGGLSAGFWLEAGINNDNGTGSATSANNQPIGAFNPVSGANGSVRPGTQGLVFNRRSTISLSSNFGEIRLGRDYVPAFWNQTNFDPFGTNGSGAASNLTQALASGSGVTTGIRASNSIGYFLPSNIGGVYGQAMFAFGENNSTATNDKDGTHTGLRIGYANGPLDVAFGYGVTKLDSVATVNGKFESINIGGTYNFETFKLFALLNRESTDVVGSYNSSKSYLIGASAPLGAGELKASFMQAKAGSDDAKANQIALGYVYNLSKRTAVYTTFSRLKNSGVTANYGFNGMTSNVADGKTTGYDLGIRHSF